MKLQAGPNHDDENNAEDGNDACDPAGEVDVVAQQSYKRCCRDDDVAAVDTDEDVQLS